MVHSNVGQMDFPSTMVRRGMLYTSLRWGSLKPVNMVSDTISNY